MLPHLRTIHKPAAPNEAVELFRRPGVYPLYGGGASLIRTNRQEVEEVVDLTSIVPVRIDGGPGRLCSVGAGVTLQALGEVSSEMAAVIRVDAPETLRNSLTLGDVLLECDPNSLVLALLCGLNANLWGPDREPIAKDRGQRSTSVEAWFGLTDEQRCQELIFYVQFDWTSVHFALEKVARTPADRPIVAAIGFVRPEEPPYAVLTGIADRPVRYREGITSAISDYRGSAEYRTAMAAIVSRRAIASAAAPAHP